MQDFHKLKVWEKAHAFALSIYKITKKFPKDELYGLTSQIRRASTSIPTNISEGCGRGSNADLARFLQISMGSASECEYLLLLSRDLCLLSQIEYETLFPDITELKRMLTGLMKTLRTDN